MTADDFVGADWWPVPSPPRIRAPMHGITIWYTITAATTVSLAHPAAAQSPL
jgi:hypothetical protein